jgi:uncharacterized protein (DUF4415 family)
MKKSSSSKASRTDWKRVKSMRDRDIKITPEHPELDLKHVARVIVRKGLKPVAAKKSISLRVDAEVLAWYQAQGPGYQTRMNAVLEAFKDAMPGGVRRQASR